jgi:hypothetical protein
MKLFLLIFILLLIASVTINVNQYKKLSATNQSLKEYMNNSVGLISEKNDSVVNILTSSINNNDILRDDYVLLVDDIADLGIKSQEIESIDLLPNDDEHYNADSNLITISNYLGQKYSTKRYFSNNEEKMILDNELHIKFKYLLVVFQSCELILNKRNGSNINKLNKMTIYLNKTYSMTKETLKSE